MSGWNIGCAVLLQEKTPLALHNYCTNHDINLVIRTYSKVPEIHVMLDSLKQLGIFFKHLPRRCRQFEDCFEQHSATLPQNKKITKKKFDVLWNTMCVNKCLKTFRRNKSHYYNVLKALNQQMVGTATVLFTLCDF